MKKKSFWKTQITETKWILIILGGFAFFSACFDLGRSRGDIEKFQDDLVRRFFPKFVYDKLNSKEQGA